MTKEITEIILTDEGFKIRTTGELVEILGGKNDMFYSGYFNEEKGNREISKAKQEIDWAIEEYNELGKDYNGFLITGKSTHPDCMKYDLQEHGKVFYQALKFKKK